MSHRASLGEALGVLQNAQKPFSDGGNAPRSVLVLNDAEEVAGEVTHWDILRALEPKYRLMGDAKAVSHAGWQADFLKSMVNNYGLLQDALDDTCQKSSTIHESFLDHGCSLADSCEIFAFSFGILGMSHETTTFIRAGGHMMPEDYLTISINFKEF